MADRIEQIARALCEHVPGTGDVEEHFRPDNGSAKIWTGMARAAYLATLRSIREPGEGALKAGGTHQGWPDITDGKIILRLEDIKMDYQAIIDHLITEAEKSDDH